MNVFNVSIMNVCASVPLEVQPWAHKDQLLSSASGSARLMHAHVQLS